MPKVLIADDSIAVRKVAERLLTEAGMGVTLAANGEEALAYLAKETPDLVVSDVIMPDKSGYEVCAFVRARRALANTPVLLISGIVNDEVTKQAESCHADGVLKKPFQGTSLKDRVIELLSKRQSTAEPVVKGIERVIESAEPSQSLRVTDEQMEIYRQAVARLKLLEEELRVERDRAMQSAQQVVQLEGQLGRVKDLESMLAREGEQTATLKGKLAEAERAVARAEELESLLSIERERTTEVTQQASVAESLRARIQELEAELQEKASRVQELEATLHAERQAASQLVEQMTAMEVVATRSQKSAQQLADRVSTLEHALETEQEKSKDLARSIPEAERAAKKAQEKLKLSTLRLANAAIKKMFALLPDLDLRGKYVADFLRQLSIDVV